MLENGLSNNHWKIYEMITRHFLACCSKDAKGDETIITASVNDEFFEIKGIAIKEQNWLEVYIYEKWTDKPIPNLQQGQILEIESLTLDTGTTTAPNLLTEASLISEMEREKIGTDATIHEHIKTVQERGYVNKISNQYLEPTNLGICLIRAYSQMQISEL